MVKRLLLVNPRTALPGYYGAEVFEAWGMTSTIGIADLATTTIAALAPADWEVTICDEHIAPAELDAEADFVGLTGKITQAPRMIELAREFRERGKIVLCGGPYASLSPDVFRGRCDVLVTGELEGIASRLFADLERGCWQCEYQGGRPELDDRPCRAGISTPTTGPWSAASRLRADVRSIANSAMSSPISVASSATSRCRR